MTERELMIAVNSDGSISEMEVADIGPKAEPLTADSEIERLLARLLPAEKMQDRYRDYCAELRTKD